MDNQRTIGPDGPYEITQCFTITDDEGNTPEFPSGVDPTDTKISTMRVYLFFRIRHHLMV